MLKLLLINSILDLESVLGFKTPYQVFFEMTGIDARQLGVVHL